MASVVSAQIRGAEYAVLEIVWWMLAALLIGLLVGWLVRGFTRARSIEAEFRSQLEDAEGRARKLGSDVDELTESQEKAAVALETANLELDASRQRVEALERELDAAEPAAADGAGEDGESGDGQNHRSEETDESSKPVEGA